MIEFNLFGITALAPLFLICPRIFSLSCPLSAITALAGANGSIGSLAAELS
jgi:hypothetical protein